MLAVRADKCCSISVIFQKVSSLKRNSVPKKGKAEAEIKCKTKAENKEETKEKAENLLPGLNLLSLKLILSLCLNLFLSLSLKPEFCSRDVIAGRNYDVWGIGKNLLL